MTEGIPAEAFNMHCLMPIGIRVLMWKDEEAGEETCWVEIEVGAQEIRLGLARILRYVTRLGVIRGLRALRRSRRLQSLRMRQEFLGLKVIEGGKHLE